MILSTNNKEALLKHNIELRTIAGRDCFVFLPKNYEKEDKSYPVVYFSGDLTTYSSLKEEEFLSELEYIIIGILSENRLDELTPWPSPSLHPKFPDFKGEGEEYLNFIETKLKPEVDTNYKTLGAPESTGLMGYSLGGLNSIYAAYRMEGFGCFASISGSLWYPGLVSFTETNSPRNPSAKIYMSSGDREGVGHKDIKKDAVAYTKKVYEILVSKLSTSSVTITWDEGGHHANTSTRYKNAFLWLNNNLKK